MFTRSKRIHDVLVDPRGNSWSMGPCGGTKKIRRMTVHCYFQKPRDILIQGEIYIYTRSKQFYRFVLLARSRREPLKGGV